MSGVVVGAVSFQAAVLEVGGFSSMEACCGQSRSAVGNMGSGDLGCALTHPASFVGTCRGFVSAIVEVPHSALVMSWRDDQLFRIFVVTWDPKRIGPSWQAGCDVLHFVVASECISWEVRQRSRESSMHELLDATVVDIYVDTTFSFTGRADERQRTPEFSGCRRLIKSRYHTIETDSSANASDGDAIRRAPAPFVSGLFNSSIGGCFSKPVQRHIGSASEGSDYSSGKHGVTLVRSRESRHHSATEAVLQITKRCRWCF
jgi:hypothetical protein